MAKNYNNITLAMAGICQSALLVQKLAHQGYCDKAALLVSLRSLLDLNPTSTLAVYGNTEANLLFGLESMLSVLNHGRQKKLGNELMRYTLSLMILERKLSKNRAAQQVLARRILQLERQLVHYELDSDTLLSAMATIYVDVISPLEPRIQVTGSPTVLQNMQIQHKIRATLLAGIRSTTLWYQMGGARWQLIFSRDRLVGEVKKILTHINQVK